MCVFGFSEILVLAILFMGEESLLIAHFFSLDLLPFWVTVGRL